MLNMDKAKEENFVIVSSLDKDRQIDAKNQIVKEMEKRVAMQKAKIDRMVLDNEDTFNRYESELKAVKLEECVLANYDFMLFRLRNEIKKLPQS